jgi:adenylate kinase
MASDAALEAVTLCSKKQFTNRMKMTVMFPEMNPSMDSYRIGTLLELVRSIAIKLAEQNLRVRVCVQGSMGVGIFTGIPKQLTGVHTLMQRMDWQSGPGEENEGMVGDYINFGYIGKEHVVNYKSDSGDNTAEIQQQDDVFLLICPQNMIGLESSIMQSLAEMVDAAGDRPVIILNPDLTDKFSSQGQQSVRGRQQRLDFVNSFETIFQFQNMYRSGTSYFPILGSVVKLGPVEPWVAHQRMDLAGDVEGEVYLPVYSSETQPESEVLMVTMSNN